MPPPPYDMLPYVILYAAKSVLCQGFFLKYVLYYIAIRMDDEGIRKCVIKEEKGSKLYKVDKCTTLLNREQMKKNGIVYSQSSWVRWLALWLL